jgi:hypothetical protein
MGFASLNLQVKGWSTAASGFQPVTLITSEET